MSTPVADEVEQPEEDWSWRLVKKSGSPTATLELGSEHSDRPDAEINFLLRVIGEALIRSGTLMLQSRLGEDEDDFDD